MSWALKGIGGTLNDKIISVRDGLTFGRKGDVEIPDGKVSSKHARIVTNSKGQFFLEDTESKNGIRVKGERIERVPLREGLKFYIGDQGFEVREIKEDLPPKRPAVVASAPPPAPAPRPPGATPPSEPEAAPKPRFWHEVLAEFLQKNAGAFKNQRHDLTPLVPALVLEFVRGPQVNSRWILGYGPRRVGMGSADLPIWEPGAPTVCFEVLPSPNGIVFKTKHPKQVTINGQPVDSHVLRVGDRIQISDTLIEVDFSE